MRGLFSRQDRHEGDGVPDHIRSGNGPEFVAQKVRGWLQRLQVGPLFIGPGDPRENRCPESFNGKLRDELLNGELSDTLPDAQVLVERWRRHYNTVRPHSSLGDRPPAPAAIQPWPSGSASGLLCPEPTAAFAGTLT